MSVQILMIASNPARAEEMAQLLSPARMRIGLRIGIPARVHDLFTDPPQVLMIDITAAGRDDPPFDLLQELRRLPEADALPRVAWGAGLDTAARVTALRAGAQEVFDQTTPQSYLLARIRNLLRARLETEDLGFEPATARLLAQADDGRSFVPSGRTAIMSGRRSLPPALAALATRLPGGAQTPDPVIPGLVPHPPAQTSGLAEAPATFQAAPMAPPREGAVDLFVIDFVPAPDAGSFGPMQLGRLLADLRARTTTRSAKLMVMIPAALPDAAALAEMAMDFGADDLVTDRVSEEELGLRVRALLHRKAQADRQRNRVTTSIAAALTDPLTGLTNRRIGLITLANLAQNRAAGGEAYAVALLDIDHFKAVNDRYGHAVGDIVLASVARALRGKLRAVDLVARFGGEEFLVALPNTTLADAVHVVERLRRMIAQHPIPLPDGLGEISVTLSVGVAEGLPKTLAKGEDDDIPRLWRAADRALYAAKGAGRNHVACAESGDMLPALKSPLAI